MLRQAVIKLFAKVVDNYVEGVSLEYAEKVLVLEYTPKQSLGYKLLHVVISDNVDEKDALLKIKEMSDLITYLKGSVV